MISTATTCWPGRWLRQQGQPVGQWPRSGAGKAHGRAAPACGLRVELHGGQAESRGHGSLTGPPPLRRCSVGLVGRLGGLVDQHRAVVGAQPGLGDRLHLLGGDVQDALDGRQRELRVAEQDGVTGTVRRRGRRPCRAGPATRAPTGPARAPSPPAVGPSAANRASSSSTALSISGTSTPPDVFTSSQPSEGAPASRSRPKPAATARAVTAHETVVEAGGLAAAQDGEREVRGVRLAGAVVRQPVGGHQRAGRDLLLDDLAQLLTDGLRQRAVARRLLAVVARGSSRSTSPPRRASARGSMSPTIDRTALLGA